MKTNQIIKNKNILITGGAGFLGNNLTERLLKYKPKKITIFSRNQKVQFNMEKKFPECNYIVGDVEDYHGLRNAIRGQDIIIHLAFFKYVPQAETFVREVCKTGVIGSMNLVDAVLDEKNVEICLGISTDKVTNAVGVYGSAKSLMERLWWQAHNNKGSIKTKFITCRYGNVAASSGSVIQLWKEKAENNQPLPVTVPTMTRFFFTIDEAVDLIEYTIENANSGEIISQEMNACLLGDLAEVMSKGKVKVEIIGKRPGEKLDECLIAYYEMPHTLKKGNKFIIKPYSNINKNPDMDQFTSDKAYRMNKEEIKQVLMKIGWY
ncbi:hypothetical protein LCGC14_2417890 [marine sediment metagenome]|uniref:Polysaccharide biosynthesis protein CapD-like domain-containing protein n=1 Tax=marine sediment metagenome TaxID=412755 RepID=A0A0F9E2M4_9ZZZZ